MAEFVMPSLGADMESGTLLEWYVKPGDVVKRGDIVALVDTSKAEIEVEIFADGVIGELLVGEGARVPVGTALATVQPMSGNGAAAAAPQPEPAAAAPQPEPAAAAPQPEPAQTAPAITVAPGAPPTAPAAPRAGRLRVSPIARRMAGELGIDLTTVRGTGPDGVIRKADVERAQGAASVAVPMPAPAERASAQALTEDGPAPAATERPAAPAEIPDRQAAMRQAIAALMARSKREIPHYYLELQIDMSRALDWLREQNLRRPVAERLLSSALLLGATARAVSQMHDLNGFWLDGAFQPGTGVHLGVAVSLRGGGLVAPAIHDADEKSLDEIMAGVRDLVQRARTGRLRSSEMSDPTITVSNLGDRGVDLVHGVIYPPQVALVGFGAVRERPWAEDGMLGVRPVVTATLAADHRASDGHAGGRLLAAIAQRLQKPEEL